MFFVVVLRVLIRRHYGFFRRGGHCFLRFRRQCRLRPCMLFVRCFLCFRRYSFHCQPRGSFICCLPFSAFSENLQSQNSFKVFPHVQRDYPCFTVRIVRTGYPGLCFFAVLIDKPDAFDVLCRQHRVGHIRADRRSFGFGLLETDHTIRVLCRVTAVSVSQNQQRCQYGACDQQCRHKQFQPARSWPGWLLLCGHAAERLTASFQISPGFPVPAVFVLFACRFLILVRLYGNLSCISFLHPSRRITDRGLLPHFLCRSLSVPCPWSSRIPRDRRPWSRGHRAGPRPAGFRPSRPVRRSRHSLCFRRHPAVRPLYAVTHRAFVHGIGVFSVCSRQAKPPGFFINNPGRCLFFCAFFCFWFLRC